MKEFKIALKNVLKVQLTCWAVFMTIDENKLMIKGIAEQSALIIGALSLLVVIFLYCKHDRTIIKENKLEPFKFNLFMYLSWGIFAYLFMLFTMLLIDKEIIHICVSGGWSCFLNGIEYAIYGIGLIGIDVLVIVAEILILIYNYLKKYL